MKRIVFVCVENSNRSQSWPVSDWYREPPGATRAMSLPDFMTGPEMELRLRAVPFDTGELQT
jgi:hypothetical protein